MLAAGRQNFVRGRGMAVLVALIRGLARHSAQTIGTSGSTDPETLYILLRCLSSWPSFLVSQGTVADPVASQTVPLLRRRPMPMATPCTSSACLGPAASQIAIKHSVQRRRLFSANSAHPSESDALSNLAEMLAILAIPAALCYTFGKMVAIRARVGRAGAMAWCSPACSP